MVEPSGHCPYLGLKQNRAIRFASPTPEHRCYVTGEPQDIPVDQATFCLSQGHVNCPLYMGLNPPSTSPYLRPVEAIPQGGLRGWLRSLSPRDRAIYTMLLGLLVVVIGIYVAVGARLLTGESTVGDNTPVQIPASVTATATAEPVASATRTPTRTRTRTPSPTITRTVTDTPTVTDTLTPTGTPTSAPSPVPTFIYFPPSSTPVYLPIPEPTVAPASPTVAPASPTAEPETPTAEPETPTAEPETPTAEPETPTAEPEPPTETPGATAEPEPPTQEPDATLEAPTTPPRPTAPQSTGIPYPGWNNE